MIMVEGRRRAMDYEQAVRLAEQYTENTGENAFVYWYAPGDYHDFESGYEWITDHEYRYVRCDIPERDIVYSTYDGEYN